jgi:Predicted membrane protein (DUF2306)
MIRTYSLTLAAVTLRLRMPIFITSGVDYTEAYVAVAWLCWVPNLMVAELIVHRISARREISV